MKWNYYILTKNDLDNRTEEINALGEQGWELVTIKRDRTLAYHFYFKKRV